MWFFNHLQFKHVRLALHLHPRKVPGPRNPQEDTNMIFEYYVLLTFATGIIAAAICALLAYWID